MELLKTPKYRSITFRMTLAFCLFLIVFQSSLAVAIYFYFRYEFKKSILQQQQTLLNVISQNIEQKLKSSHKVLIDVARQVPAAIVTNADRAQAFLDRRPGTHSLFDNGLFLFSTNGAIIAESPYRQHRRGRDISFREYFTRTKASGQPCISNPYVSTHTPGAPAVMFTAPVRNEQGKLIAILGGSLNLQNDNWLGDLSKIRIANKGYLYIVNRDRTIIMHPDKMRIMQDPEPPGTNLLLDAALKGFEGSAENINSQGVRSLTTLKQLPSTGWILGANYPVNEAFSTIHTFRKFLVMAIVLSVLISIVIVRLLMVRFTMSLVEFAEHVRNIASKKNSDRLFLRDSSDEIGVLARMFNEMIRREDQKSRDLLFASTHDSMTALYNRAFFDSELERLSKGRVAPVSIVIADIDGLKACNDRAGHAAGDELIRAAASILQEAFRGEDIVARIGGDEFGVILPGAGYRQAAAAIERVRANELNPDDSGTSCRVKISLGAATSDSPDGLQEAFRQADRLMYADKARRRTSEW